MTAASPPAAMVDSGFECSGFECSGPDRSGLAVAALLPEEVRQRRLERLLTVDHATEVRFARVIRLATMTFGVAAATVTLVDDQPTPPGGPALPWGLVGRDFVTRTVESGASLLIEDTTADAESAGLVPVVGPPFVRFFAGVPLADDEGVVLGAFCLYDTVPRRLDSVQRTTLAELAEWVRRDLVDSEEMARARRVQESLLPRSAPVVPGYRIGAVCVPTKSVGGDFYDFGTAPRRLTFGLVDVMGKGTAAALVAATVRALLRASMSEVALGLGGREAQRQVEPIRGGIGGVVADIDRLVSADLERTSTLVTGFFGDLLPETGVIRYADAGHGLTVLLRAGGDVFWLRSSDLPIGVEPAGRWSDHEVVLEPGDTLLCVSDGLLDLVGGTEQALDEIARLPRDHSHPDDLIRRIRRLTELGIAIDDVTAVVIRREETAP